MNKENLEKIFNEDLGTSFFPQLAEEYIKEGDYELAKKVCNVGLLLNPHNNDGKYILAKIMMVDGDGKGAEGILKEILSEDTLYVNALRLLVMYYNSKSIKQVEMIKMVHQILDLIPNDEFASEILKASKKPTKPIKRKKVAKQVTAKKSKGSKRKPTLKSPRAIASEPENNKIDSWKRLIDSIINESDQELSRVVMESRNLIEEKYSLTKFNKEIENILLK